VKKERFLKKVWFNAEFAWKTNFTDWARGATSPSEGSPRTAFWVWSGRTAAQFSPQTVKNIRHRLNFPVGQPVFATVPPQLRQKFAEFTTFGASSPLWGCMNSIVAALRPPRLAQGVANRA
jgi:hypothetical protein